MKNWLYTIAPVLIGIGVGAVFSHPISTQAGWLIMSIGILIFVCLLFNDWFRPKLWPSERNWRYCYRDGSAGKWHKVFKENEIAPNWQSDNPQSETASYTLDIQKERMINTFEFLTGFSFLFPEEWEVAFFDKSHKYLSPFKKNTLRKDAFRFSGKGEIRGKLEVPVKAQYIHIKITKAKEGAFWEIRDIVLTENRLFNYWWKRKIGE